jgi:hypothetical protein
MPTKQKKLLLHVRIVLTHLKNEYQIRRNL